MTYIIGRLNVHEEAEEGGDVHLGLQLVQCSAAPVLELIPALLLPSHLLIILLLLASLDTRVVDVAARGLLLNLLLLLLLLLLLWQNWIPESLWSHNSSSGDTILT